MCSRAQLLVWEAPYVPEYFFPEADLEVDLRPAGEGPRYDYLHHAQGDHSRMVYSEILTDETKETAAAFTTRALDHFAARGIRVERVSTASRRLRSSSA